MLAAVFHIPPEDVAPPQDALPLAVLQAAEQRAPFVAGAENRLLATAIADLLTAEDCSYNPLVIHGPPGAGKSLLVERLAHSWRTRRPADAVVVIGGADFARELATAIETDAMARFRARFRRSGLFVLEDLTQLAAKKAALEELMRSLDATLIAGGQVVVTSRLPPHQLPTLPEGLAARLTGGLVVPVAPPGLEARLAIVEQQAARRGISLHDGAGRAIAESIKGSAPELIGALLDLQVNARVDGQAVNAERVRKQLSERDGPRKLSLRGITAATARYFGLKVADLTSPSRRRAVVQARGVAMYLARELAGKSLAQVGKHFGGRDHTTVLHSYRTTEKRIRSDPHLRRAVADLRRMLAVS